MEAGRGNGERDNVGGPGVFLLSPCGPGVFLLSPCGSGSRSQLFRHSRVVQIGTTFLDGILTVLI